MTNAEFQQGLERYFDSLYRQYAAAQIVYQEASKRFDGILAANLTRLARGGFELFRCHFVSFLSLRRSKTIASARAYSTPQ